MKRLVAMLMAVALLVVLVVGCTQTPQSGTPTTGQSTQAPGSTTAPGTKEPEGTPGTVGSGNAVQKDAFDNFPRPRVNTDGLKFGLIHSAPAWESVRASYEQVQVEAYHRGWTYVDGQFDQESEIRDIWQSLLDQGCDAIILHSFDFIESYADMIAKSRNAGVGVYNTEMEAIEGIVGRCGFAGAAAGIQMAYLLGDMYDWNVNIAIISAMASSAHEERARAFEALSKVFPSFNLLAYEDPGDSASSIAGSYRIATAWVQQYGDKLDVIVTSADVFAQVAAQAVQAAGNTHIKTMGLDGDNNSLVALNEGGPFLMCWPQPSGQMIHTVCEMIDQIQVQNLNPGDPGCILTRARETLRVTGSFVDASNLPAVGKPWHSVFDYYDESNPDGWWNWAPPPGLEIGRVQY